MQCIQAVLRRAGEAGRPRRGILRHSFLPFVLEALHLRSGGQGQEEGGKRLRDGPRRRGEIIVFLRNLLIDCHLIVDYFLLHQKVWYGFIGAGVSRNEQTNDENPFLRGFLVSMLLPPRLPFLR